MRHCLQTQAVDKAITEQAATGAANSVPDPNPNPSPVGNGDLVPDRKQSSMDVSEPKVEPTPRNTCVCIQMDTAQTRTRWNQMKIKVRYIGEDISILVVKLVGSLCKEVDKDKHFLAIVFFL